MKIYNWRPFLERWSADWADSPGARGRDGVDEEILRARWLGFEPVSEERITALEERLGTRLPPTYRSFLATTDGWRPSGTAVYLLGTAEGVHWHRGKEMRELYESDLTENSPEEDILRAGMWDRALQLSLDSDMTDVLLDPGDVNADGEWAVYVYRGWSGEFPARYESFMDVMQYLFRNFHQSVEDGGTAVNETARELDAAVEEARLACLAGADVDEQLELLTDAAAHGRGAAAALERQVRTMLGEGRESGPEYEAPGAFGRAVTAAREQARWGETEAAWQTVAAAVPDWEPGGAGEIAPVRLLSDPVLGPVITPERGRYILETPRAGYGSGEDRPAAVAPGTAATSAVDGLDWLAGSDQFGRGYRFVCVHGISPQELAGRIGRGPLLPPCDERDIQRIRFSGDSTRVARVGAGGGGWSFAFETMVGAYQPGRVEGPADEASMGTRSVVVWAERGDASGAFHFSYARDGRRVHGFAVHGGKTERWGPLPDTLDPGVLLPGAGAPELDVDDEFEALAAIADEFGLSLPSFAIQHGRLHAVESRDWIRPPGPGEAYATFGWTG